jgi:transposase
VNEKKPQRLTISPYNLQKDCEETIVRRTEEMKIVEILRLTDMGLSLRAISISAGCSKTTTGDIVRLCKSRGITYETANQMTDDALHEALYPTQATARAKRMAGRKPDWDSIHEALVTQKGMNLQYLWEEYRSRHAEGLSYSQFCAQYRAYRKAEKRNVSLHQERKAGEIMEVDWIGDTITCVVDERTGSKIPAHFFVSILGYSLYPYVEAFPDEREPSWITAHVNALHYYGGVPCKIIPDNCRTAVAMPKYYEPVINSAYWELSKHYGVAIVPARIHKPKDKPAVEQTVRWLETWLLGKLRNQTFFGFPELNKSIRKHLGELSTRAFQKREGTRYSAFMDIDQPALRPLPTQKYEIAEVVKRKVGDNYHLVFDGFYYSVPYTMLGQTVILRATTTTIEVLDRQHTRIASHMRRKIAGQGRYITCQEHMPPNHQAVQQQRDFDGKRYRNWAQKIGMNTYRVVDRLLTANPAEEQGYKSCMGILQFANKYGAEALETACARACMSGAYSYTAVKMILKNVKADGGHPDTDQRTTPEHENIRGSAYYQ